ncbi:MAG: sensor histidine kinase [Methylovirgula sp.]
MRLALRCVPTATDKFSILSKKIQELNAEIGERRRTQAALEDTLEANEILLRELQHRVKNIIQLIISLFSTARRESNSLELKTFIAEANRRLLALGTAHNLMYQSQEMRAIPAKPLLTSLCSAIGTTLGPAVRIDVTSAEDELSNEAAFPLALIVNELVTNAFKHGLNGGGGAIQVVLQRNGPEYMLVIHDNGPGFPDTVAERRATGLGLVRGLCRQIGGALQTENADGARCIVRFSDTAHAKSGS